jgi:biopolymer transport protein ExbD
MEGTKIKLRSRKKARIEIIPLIDVIFFLLATFVLFTLSLNRIQSVEVNLPVAGPPQPPPLPEILTIQVSNDGALFWNREAIEMDELRGRIMAYKSQTTDPKVLIAGDEKARFGTTIHVLDEVRNAGITKFSIETKPRGTGR